MNSDSLIKGLRDAARTDSQNYSLKEGYTQKSHADKRNAVRYSATARALRDMATYSSGLTSANRQAFLDQTAGAFALSSWLVDVLVKEAANDEFGKLTDSWQRFLASSDDESWEARMGNLWRVGRRGDSVCGPRLLPRTLQPRQRVPKLPPKPPPKNPSST